MSINLQQELAFLECASKEYLTKNSPFEKKMRELIVRIFSPYLTKDSIVAELGCDEGFVTQKVAPMVKELDVIDGSQIFLEKMLGKIKKEGISNVNAVYSLFEEIKGEKKYDFVFATYILEHVLNPVTVLKKVSNILKDNGLLFIVVPNSNALSRKLALNMDILNSLKELTENDLRHGHRRVYDMVTLKRDINSAGFETISQGGLMLKILADFQMDKLIELEILNDTQIEGLYKLGLEYPDLAGSLFAVCKKLQK